MSVTAEVDLVARVRAGEARAAARLMTWAERGDPRYAEAHARFAGGLGRAMRVGVTGPPGAGKSTLVEGLARHWRGAGRRIGVVAVDPSSPFTGGALLGDRVRMAGLALDEGVFIRSMATRGVFGGLARATDDVADVLDLFERDVVLLETVGVGQSEVDVARSADLTVVVLHPGGGDTIQAMKAGLMEVADVYLVNKADLPGLERLVQDLQDVLELAPGPREGRPPILTAVATTGQGVAEAAAGLEQLFEQRRASGALAARRLENTERRVRRVVEGRLHRDVWDTAGLGRRLSERLAGDAEVSAYRVADEILSTYRDLREQEGAA